MINYSQCLQRSFARIQAYWVYGGALAALVLLALVPLVWSVWPPALLLVYVGLPLYMFHQFEEHDRNRFGDFVNERFGHGATLITPQAIFWINIVLVWVWFVVVLYLVAMVSAGLALLAVGPVFLNALVHIVQAVRMRCYNPGLITAIVLLLPWSLWAWLTLGAHVALTPLDYAAAVAAALAIHGVIVAYVLRRM